MSAEEFMRMFADRAGFTLSDWQIALLLADARVRRATEGSRWRRRQWRRVEARAGETPRRSAMRAAYRARRRKW